MNETTHNRFAIKTAVVGSVLLSFFWFFNELIPRGGFDGEPTNGAFQLFNPLRRLLAGQTPGLEFPIFHGIGAFLIHFPFFWAFGADFRAAELSRHLVSPLAYCGSLYFVLRSFEFTRSAAWILSLFSLLTLEYFGISGLSSAGNGSLGVRAATPLILSGVMARMFAAKRFSRVNILISLSAMLGLCLFVSVEQGTASLAALSCVLIVSNPFGLPFFRRTLDAVIVSLAGLAFFVLLLLAFTGRGTEPYLEFIFQLIPKEQFWYFGVPPNGYVAGVADLLSLSGLSLRLGLALILIILILRLSPPYRTVLASKLALQRNTISPLLFILLYGLFAAGGLLGYAGAHYLDPLLRSLALASLILLHRLFKFSFPSVVTSYGPWSLLAIVSLSGLTLFGPQRIYPAFRWSQYPLELSALDAAIFSEVNGGELTRGLDGVRLGALWSVTMAQVQSCLGARQLPVRIQGHGRLNLSPGLPGSLPKYFIVEISTAPSGLRDVLPGDELQIEGLPGTKIFRVFGNVLLIDASSVPESSLESGAHAIVRLGHEISSSSNWSIWSTYAGIVEYKYDRFHPDTDYIIHALGQKKRAEYVAHFIAAKPTYVLTLQPNISRYEPWLKNAHWDFYEQILNNYRPVLSTPIYILWERNSSPASSNSLDSDWQDISSISEEGTNFYLPSSSEAEPFLYTAEVSYKLSTPYSWFPLFGKLSRFFIHSEGALTTLPVSLPPYETVFRFPVLAAADRVKLNFETVTPIGIPASGEVSRLRVRKIAASSDAISAIRGTLPVGYNSCSHNLQLSADLRLSENDR